MNANLFSRCIRILLLLAAGIALIVLFGVAVRSTCCITRIIGTSMNPTLHNGQIVTGLPVKLNPAQEVCHSDIVTLRTSSGKTIIKRVIAIPGDTLEIRGNQVYLNGTALQEDYIAEPMQTHDLAAFTLGEDEYFVLGDNRNNSADSRYYGLFSRSDILSVVQTQFNVLPILLFLAIASGFVICGSLVYDKLESEWISAREQVKSQRRTQSQDMPSISNSF